MPEAMVVKSAKMRDSESIQYELQGEEVYNLALEVAWGSLARLIKVFGRGLPESDVRRYTCDLLEGIRHIHKCCYVHCDLKPHNILVVENEDDDVYRLVAKVADLGLAKKKDEVQDVLILGPVERWRGTPMYLSPETILYNEQEEPSDIWALGCIVLEMLTG
ncbi:mitogen-activated protein kinase kinase kinase 20-like [Rosa chinensis]|uniref:mitogen-activated protein kinase kinase kinase 20-like n=1 Tax=Rosa chinensis TaxID=74649 RepID=UPI001AD8B7AC|nr:mitogen-activated protein kinase kinase kinase 20-like [Rosa chinensis]